MVAPVNRILNRIALSQSGTILRMMSQSSTILRMMSQSGESEWYHIENDGSRVLGV